MNLVFYGASDDLVEVDGDFREEFSSLPTDALRIVLVGDGGKTAIHVRYENNGIWTVSAVPADEDVPTVPGASYELSLAPHTDWALGAGAPAYSAALRYTGPNVKVEVQS